jgi:hypothetical protein
MKMCFTSLPGAGLKELTHNQGKYEIKCEKQEVVEMKTTEITGNKPEKKFSTGAISATVWKNNGTSKKDGSQVEFRTIQLDRRYKDKDGSWKSTNSLRVNDLPKATLVLNKAYEYLVIREQDASPTGEIDIEEIVM